MKLVNRLPARKPPARLRLVVHTQKRLLLNPHLDVPKQVPAVQHLPDVPLQPKYPVRQMQLLLNAADKKLLKRPVRRLVPLRSLPNFARPNIKLCPPR